MKRSRSIRGQTSGLKESGDNNAAASPRPSCAKKPGWPNTRFMPGASGPRKRQMRFTPSYVFNALESNEPRAGPDHVTVWGGSRQNSVAVGATKVGSAPAGVGAVGWQTRPIGTGIAARGAVEESVWRRGAIRPEPVHSADSLPGKTSNWRLATVPRDGQPRYRAGPRHLDVLRQRRRQDGSRFAILLRFLRAAHNRKPATSPSQA